MDLIRTATRHPLAIVAVFGVLEWWAPISVLPGLLRGFFNRLRVWRLEPLIPLPTLANSLDVTPSEGPYSSAIIANFSIFIAGFAVPCSLSVIVSRLGDYDLAEPAPEESRRDVAD